jgi:hypothetical protein
VISVAVIRGCRYNGNRTYPLSSQIVMEIDCSSNRAWLSTPKVFVQAIVVVFGGLTESRTGGKCFQPKSVTQNHEFALFVQNELELRSRCQNLGISLRQPRFRFTLRLFKHLSTPHRCDF